MGAKVDPHFWAKVLDETTVVYDSACSEHTLLMYPFKKFPRTALVHVSENQNGSESEEDEDFDSANNLSDIEEISYEQDFHWVLSMTKNCPDLSVKGRKIRRTFELASSILPATIQGIFGSSRGQG